MTAPNWKHYTVRSSSGDMAYLASVGGGPVARIDRIDGGTTGDFAAYPEMMAGYRGGLSGAWGRDGNLYVLPGADGGPHLRAFDRYGTLVRNEMVGDPSQRRGYAPVLVDVVREKRVEVIREKVVHVPGPTVYVDKPVPGPTQYVTVPPLVEDGDMTSHSILRVYIDWKSVRFPGTESAVRELIRGCREGLGGASPRFAFRAGPPPASLWAGWCWITVGVDLNGLLGRGPMAGHADGVGIMYEAQVNWWARRGASIDDSRHRSPRGMGLGAAHEIAHTIGAPSTHEWTQADTPQVLAGVDRAVTVISAKWRAA